MAKIIKVNRYRPQKGIIKKAAQIIREGDLVAFPTETVYGLGADALNSSALKKVFKAKNRPSDNPFILHIAQKKSLSNLTRDIPLSAKKLIKKFWPGPLTIVLKKHPSLPKHTTCNLSTVAVRMPKNKVALALIKAANTPIAAPSANASTRPSPTKAMHVKDDLNKKIPLILDGGSCKVGVESTVVDCTTNPPMLLRPGGITLEQLRKVVPKIKTLSKYTFSSEKKVKSPGLKYKHYAPKAKLFLLTGEKAAVTKKTEEIIKQLASKKGKQKICVLSNKKTAKTPLPSKKNLLYLSFGSSKKSQAHNLFALLRECDKKKVDLILVAGVSESGLGLAIMNRLKKAANKIFEC